MTPKEKYSTLKSGIADMIMAHQQEVTILNSLTNQIKSIKSMGYIIADDDGNTISEYANKIAIHQEIISQLKTILKSA